MEIGFMSESPLGPPEMPPPDGLFVIGRREWVDFPEWGLTHVRAKVDTGAYSSALDVAGYDLFEGPGAVLMARLRLVLSRRRPQQVEEVAAPVVRLVTVCNSGGLRERRPLLEPLLRLGPVTRRIRLTITNRSRMRTRMLLGREALAGAFLVDVSRKYLWRA
jgi:hypothetical protein